MSEELIPAVAILSMARTAKEPILAGDAPPGTWKGVPGAQGRYRRSHVAVLGRRAPSLPEVRVRIPGSKCPDEQPAPVAREGSVTPSRAGSAGSSARRGEW